MQVVVDIPDASNELLERQSARASHRADVRARRAAERLLLRTEATTDTTPPPLRACSRPRGSCCRPARQPVREPTARAALAPGRPLPAAKPPRAAEIARRVLTAAGEAVPERPRATGEEAPHV